MQANIPSALFDCFLPGGGRFATCAVSRRVALCIHICIHIFQTPPIFTHFPNFPHFSLYKSENICYNIVIMPMRERRR